MTIVDKPMWESLSMEMDHKVAALATTHLSRRARWIVDGLPAISSEVSNDEDDPIMNTGLVDTAPTPALVDVDVAMDRVQAHYKDTMTEVRHVLALMSAV
ncbi:hypothetical protein D1007_23032 [Hordeum vulgare]|nr:hypothetical protein D1007_23032 [Hordeum vulgare]